MHVNSHRVDQTARRSKVTRSVFRFSIEVPVVKTTDLGQQQQRLREIGISRGLRVRGEEQWCGGRKRVC